MRPDTRSDARLLASLRALRDEWLRDAEALDHATHGEWIEPGVKRECAEDLDGLLRDVESQDEPTKNDDDPSRVDGEQLSHRQELPQPANGDESPMNETETPTAALRERIQQLRQQRHLGHGPHCTCGEREAFELIGRIESDLRHLLVAHAQEVEKALSLARHAVNGWACHSKTKREQDEIGRLHREIDALAPSETA